MAARTHASPSGIEHRVALELFNTLSGKIEPLYASDGHALRFYCCGPTTYDYGHIGNFRTFLHVDVLRRTARLLGVGDATITTVKHVMNITDVDDKIIRNAAAAGQPIGTYSAKFEQAFFEDMDALGIERPEHIARATENIDGMVSLIQRLAAEDIAYKAEDGSWYFRIARFPAYGKLSKKDLSGIEDGARVDLDEYDKDSARDFALWKSTKPDDQASNAAWDTPLGTGRPGWHIECSAMASKYLGDSFDLHAGGEDLMFPHHENEIAQSEAVWQGKPDAAAHTPFARHWFHVRFLLVEGKKMSKSEGNFYTLRDLLLKGHRASAIRFLLLSVPYRHQLNFTFDGLTESTNAIDRLRTFSQRLSESAFNTTIPLDEELASETTKAEAAFVGSLSKDLNTAEARAAIFDFVRFANTRLDERAAGGRPIGSANRDQIRALLDKFDSIFAVLEDRDADLTRDALAWAEAEGRMSQVSPEVLEKFGSTSLTDAAIEALIADRTLAKKQRNFPRADAIRKDLLEKGILLEDSKDGVRWKRT